MWRILSIFRCLTPSYWRRNPTTPTNTNTSNNTEAVRTLRKLEPLNFTEHPDLRKLQSLGAGPSILRECQDGFRKFENECSIDDLTEAYSTLIKAEGRTSGHLTLFNHMVGFLKNDDRFDLLLLAEEFSNEI